MRSCQAKENFVSRAEVAPRVHQRREFHHPPRQQGASYLMSPQPTVVMVTTAHQKASGMLLKQERSEPASAKYTAEEKSTTPASDNKHVTDDTLVQLEEPTRSTFLRQLAPRPNSLQPSLGEKEHLPGSWASEPPK